MGYDLDEIGYTYVISSDTSYYVSAYMYAHQYGREAQSGCEVSVTFGGGKKSQYFHFMHSADKHQHNKGRLGGRTSDTVVFI